MATPLLVSTFISHHQLIRYKQDKQCTGNGT